MCSAHFRDFSAAEIATLACTLNVLKFKRDDTIVYQGEPATFFAVVLEGTLAPMVNGEPLANMARGVGELVGELALFSGGHRQVRPSRRTAAGAWRHSTHLYLKEPAALSLSRTCSLRLDRPPILTFRRRSWAWPLPLPQPFGVTHGHALNRTPYPLPNLQASLMGTADGFLAVFTFAELERLRTSAEEAQCSIGRKLNHQLACAALSKQLEQEGGRTLDSLTDDERQERLIELRLQQAAQKWGERAAGEQGTRKVRTPACSCLDLSSSLQLAFTFVAVLLFT